MGGFYHRDKPDLIFLNQEDDFHLTVNNNKPKTEKCKKFFEEYGDIKDIYVTSHWKFQMSFNFIVEKQDEPLYTSLNNYDYNINKFSTTCHNWDKIVKYFE